MGSRKEIRNRGIMDKGLIRNNYIIIYIYIYIIYIERERERERARDVILIFISVCIYICYIMYTTKSPQR